MYKISFNGFIFEPNKDYDLDKINSFILSKFNKEFIIEKISNFANLYILKFPDTEISTKEAWNYYYEFDRNLFDLIEPDFNTILLKNELESDQKNATPLPGTEYENWARNQINIDDEIWKLTKGEGITIGHTDTGYTNHFELIDNNNSQEYGLQPNKGWDYEDGDNNAIDNSGSIPYVHFFGHGTSTASVIISNHQSGYIKGIAPKSKLIPIRIDDTVLVNIEKLIRGYDFAIYRNCKIISTSMGNVLGDGFALDKILKIATDNGILVFAAVGQVNDVDIPCETEILPSKSSYTVSCSATNIYKQPYAFSFKSIYTNVCAPGESVWVARPKSSHDPGKGVERSDGTSFATAITAASAALWYSLARPEYLYKTYGKNKILPLYLKTLEEYGLNPWNYNVFGPGILNVKNHLKSINNLPSKEDIDKFYENYQLRFYKNDIEKIAEIISNSVQPEILEKLFLDLFNINKLKFISTINIISLEIRFLLRSNRDLLNYFKIKVKLYQESDNFKLNQSDIENIKKIINNNCSTKILSILN